MSSHARFYDRFHEYAGESNISGIVNPPNMVLEDMKAITREGGLDWGGTSPEKGSKGKGSPSPKKQKKGKSR